MKQTISITNEMPCMAVVDNRPTAMLYIDLSVECNHDKECKILEHIGLCGYRCVKVCHSYHSTLLSSLDWCEEHKVSALFVPDLRHISSSYAEFLTNMEYIRRYIKGLTVRSFSLDSAVPFNEPLLTAMYGLDCTDRLFISKE